MKLPPQTSPALRAQIKQVQEACLVVSRAIGKTEVACAREGIVWPEAVKVILMQLDLNTSFLSTLLKEEV